MATPFSALSSISLFVSLSVKTSLCLGPPRSGSSGTGIHTKQARSACNCTDPGEMRSKHVQGLCASNLDRAFAVDFGPIPLEFGPPVGSRLCRLVLWKFGVGLEGFGLGFGT